MDINEGDSQAEEPKEPVGDSVLVLRPRVGDIRSNLDWLFDSGDSRLYFVSLSEFSPVQDSGPSTDIDKRWIIVQILKELIF